MATAAGIRAAKAYVEIGSNTSKLTRGLNSAKMQLQSFAATAKTMGGSLLAVGGSIAAPIVAGVKSYADFEQGLADIRASANPTNEEMAALRDTALDISKRTGAGPTAIVESFGELLKAGMSVEDVLGGAGEAAVKFARVGKLETAEAAVTMADAMKVFGRDGLSAANVTDILSGAADASSVSIRQITEAFQQASAVSGLSGQSLTDTATAISLLGNEGIKGSDAGTSLKTALMRLMDPTTEASKVMKKYGIEVRNADGTMRSLPQIAGELQRSLGGLNDSARDQALGDLFGQDAIRTGAVLLKYGSQGFVDLRSKIESALPVASKFDIVMNTLWGKLEVLGSALQRAGIAIGTALAPSLTWLGDKLIAVVGWLQKFAEKNAELVFTVAAVAGGLVILGGVLVSVGFVAAGIAAGVTIFGIALAAILSPITWVAIAVAGLVAGIVYATGIVGILSSAFAGTWNDIKAALGKGDLKLAFQIVWAEIQIVWQSGVLLMQQTLIDALAGMLDAVDSFAKKVSEVIGWATGGFLEGVGSAMGEFGPTSSSSASWLATTAAALRATKGVLPAQEELNRLLAERARLSMQVNAADFATGPNNAGNAMGRWIRNAIGGANGNRGGNIAARLSNALSTSIAGTFRGRDISGLLQTKATPNEEKQTALLQEIANNTSDIVPAFK